MKTNVLRLIIPGTTVLLLALITSPIASAQSSPPALSVPNNSVTPPVLPPDIDPGSPLGQVVQMILSQTDPNTILTFVSHSTVPFNLSPTDIAYLNDLGVPNEIISAMVQHDQQLGVTISAQPQPQPLNETQQPEDITEDYFYGALAPYGSWVNLPNYGLCWQPCAPSYNAGWAPYCTQGRWAYTDCGWYWMSNYSWGWSTFHYGRWFHDTNRGWCWQPGTTWAPSWVFWRQAGNYCGWAPLPPNSYYKQGTGLVYNGAAVAPGFGFGINANQFSFVPMANLGDANVDRYRLATAQASQIFNRSQVLSDINSNDRTIVNDGISVSHIASVTGKVMPSYTLQPVKTVAARGVRGEQVQADGRTLAINRPYFNSSAPSSLRQGIAPAPAQGQPVIHRPQSIIVYGNPNSSPAYTPQNNNSVYYVDRGGPSVPRVTTAGPQNRDSSYSSASYNAPSSSYWSSSAETPLPQNNGSPYESPRSRGHFHQTTRQPENRREFNPSPGANEAFHNTPHEQSRPQEQHGNSSAPHVESQPSHSSSPAPNHAAPPAQNHGR